MTRYGYAIRIGGDPEISGALATGMAAAGATATKGRPLGDGPGSEAVRRVAMHQHTPEEWARMTEEARVVYGGKPWAPRWAEKLLIGWALVCYGVSRLYQMQDRVLGPTERRV